MPFKPLYRIISPQIEYVEHGQGADIMQAIFGCQKHDLPEGEGWAEENITLSTHLGTHVDAPWHYGSKTGEAEAITVDQIPLEELFLDGVVLDVSHLKGSGKAITVDDIKAALDKIGYAIKAKDAVLFAHRSRQIYPHRSTALQLSGIDRRVCYFYRRRRCHRGWY